MQITKNGEYDDIINLPHHQSATRPHMTLHDRAAQFSPFAALTGHDAAIAETARLTDKKIYLSEDRISVINAKLQVIGEHIQDHPEITVTYFRQDDRKDGGAYITKTGRIKKMADVFCGVVDGKAQIPGPSLLHVGITVVELPGLVGRRRKASVGQDFVRRIEAGEVTYLGQDHGSHAETYSRNGGNG